MLAEHHPLKSKMQPLTCGPPGVIARNLQLG